MCKYYKQALLTGELIVLVRIMNNRVEHYEGKGIWNKDWPAAIHVYMHIIGMGDRSYLYREVDEEEVEEIKRQLDNRYKKWGMFAYKNADPTI